MRKKILLAMVICFLVACNNKKEEEKKSTAADTTTTVTPTNTPASNASLDAASKEATTNLGADVKFADPEVQKAADAYTVFIETYKGGTMLDRKQLKPYLKEVQDWNVKINNIALKLANNPAEALKWTEWAKRLSAKYQVKVNK